jgi:diguanylate cyclase (GGDEF)-like protein
VNAATDALTGLYNRRLFEEYFEKELSRAKRSGQQLALVILDLHRFKEVNDRYGHQQGDHALRLAAAAAKDTARASDYTFRIGGDEFAILLPNCDEARCAALSRRVRAGYEAAIGKFGFDVPLTLDFGIAVSPDDGEERESLIRLADRRLYEMKTTARLRDGGAETQHLAEAPASVESRTHVAEQVEGTAMGGGQESGRDRRHWERVPMTGTSAHVVWQEGEMVAAPVIDVSYGGVAILVEDPDIFPPSFRGVLHMPIQLPVPVSLRKTSEQRTDGKGTRMGCAFIS